MRNSEKFDLTWKDLEFYLSFHKVPVWLVPREDDYYLSVVKPQAEELPVGTCANLYGVGFKIIETICASK